MTTHNDGQLYIVVGGNKITGWQEINLTRGVEVFPPHFDLTLTEKTPDQPSGIVIFADDECEVFIGDDKVLTGYVNEYSAEVSGNSHTVRISGRGKCQDLLDCSAFFGSADNPQLYYNSSIDIVNIARELVKPYGIKVVVKSTGDAKPVYNMHINAGESCYEVISRLARYEGLMVREDVDGNLVLDRVNKSTRHSGGFRQAPDDGLAINVQRATMSLTSDQRYSNYYVLAYAINSAADLPDTHNVLGKAVDPDSLRTRILIDVNPLFDVGISGTLAQRYADWTANRRWGRSEVVTLTADTWRDSGGRLWEPNFLASINCPAIKANNLNWMIGQVTYKRSLASGTTAEVILMPPSAFDIEPIVLNQQGFSDILGALNKADASTLGGAPT